MEEDFYVRKSFIHGNGLFSNTYIPKNTIIWKEHENCKYYNVDELQKLGVKHIAEHSFYSNYKNKFIYSDDLFMFINHSDHPNCITIDGENVQTITLTDIYPGDELFEDYSTFDNNPETKQICKYYDIYSPVL